MILGRIGYPGSNLEEGVRFHSAHSSGTSQQSHYLFWPSFSSETAQLNAGYNGAGIPVWGSFSRSSCKTPRIIRGLCLMPSRVAAHESAGALTCLFPASVFLLLDSCCFTWLSTHLYPILVNASRSHLAASRARKVIGLGGAALPQHLIYRGTDTEALLHDPSFGCTERYTDSDRLKLPWLRLSLLLKTWQSCHRQARAQSVTRVLRIFGARTR